MNNKITPPTTFVLIHGSWHGGWCWKKVAPILRDLGHQVYTPSLSGCGEHFSNDDCAATLDLFVNDICQLLHYEDLCNVVLVGHSYAGLIIQGVANKTPERLSGLIYFDAYVAAPNQCGFDLWGKQQADEARMLMADGQKTRQPLVPELLGVSEPKLVAWVSKRLKPFPLQAFEGRVEKENSQASLLPRVYFQCTNGLLTTMFTSIIEKVSHWGWTVLSFDWPHDAMLTHPAEFAQACAAFNQKIDFTDSDTGSNWSNQQRSS